MYGTRLAVRQGQRCTGSHINHRTCPCHFQHIAVQVKRHIAGNRKGRGNINASYRIASIQTVGAAAQGHVVGNVIISQRRPRRLWDFIFRNPENTFLLNIIVCQSTPRTQQLSPKVQILTGCWNTYLIAYFLFNIVDAVARLHFKRKRLAIRHLHRNLHCACAHAQNHHTHAKRRQ